VLVILHGHADIVAGAVYSADRQSIATASGDGTVKIWDAATGQEIATLPGHTGGVRAVAWSSDGRFIATAGADGTVRQYIARLPDLMMLAARHVTRGLTAEERAIYLGEPTTVPAPAPTVSPGAAP
jgi:WD40 repeat protein